MYNETRVLAKRIVFGLLALSMMVVIFLFSSQTGEESGELSNGITEVIVEVVSKTFDLDIKENPESMETFHLVIRKIAHFTVYFVLGLFISLFLCSFEGRLIVQSGISLGIAAVYAISDEIHQSFVGGRAMAVWDMIIDTSGALLAVLIVFLILKSSYKKHKKQEVQVEIYPI